MACNCPDDKNKEKLIMSDENSLDVILTSPNIGQRYIHGAVSRVRYGYYGGGDLIPGVHKEDIRARPSWFSCGKCRSALTVTKTEVYCESCRRPEAVKVDQVALAKSVEVIRSVPLPPPPPVAIIKEKPFANEKLEATYQDAAFDADDWMEDVPTREEFLESQEGSSSALIADINFGQKLNVTRKKILGDAGVVTLADSLELGHDGIIAIKGVGSSIADTLIEEALIEKENMT